jgi:protein O-GlcNAc transferase
MKKRVELKGLQAIKKHSLMNTHLARHKLADLFLDTFTFNAATTATDALWAGLPVISLSGPIAAGRLCASMLKTLEYQS